ncbi:535_t:CDS:10 [Funneliformis geosporum]|uniref:684_t:CDS:1 n=1 Tax=Funneliformis geosporum TaxID=1117311 RepID=A0A9W4WR89_9GLOM|nr:684_t:CDS:10 [Funneliformis geosporum]CAI2181691.1 535_t:CDS:10 [Funneliformis geosporum]
MPGWENSSRGYRGDDGQMFFNTVGKPNGPKFMTGIAFRDLKNAFYPCIGMLSPGGSVGANFGFGINHLDNIATITITLVTRRSIGIGAYLVRLRQRTIQNESTAQNDLKDSLEVILVICLPKGFTIHDGVGKYEIERNPNSWVSGFFDKGSFAETLSIWAKLDEHVLILIRVDDGKPDRIFVNWRGFSGGQRDMFKEILKYVSYIVDQLPTTSSLAGVLEPEGIVEIKLRKPQFLATIEID